MGRIAELIAVATGIAVLAGCGGSGQSKVDPEKLYVARLNAAQATLANAEKAIPTNASTPAMLSRSIGLLATAITKLGDDLQAIVPPAKVVSEHRRLVTLVRAYA